MKRKLLVAIGNEFTQQWIDSQEDPKFKGFKRSAEYCLSDVKFSTVTSFIPKLLTILALYILFFDSFIMGCIIFFVAIGINFLVLKFLKQGTTTEKIAKDWKPIRRELLKQGLVSKCLKVFKRDHPTYDFFPEDLVRELLVKSIDELMSSLSANLIEAQREGFPEKEESIKRKMVDLKQLTWDMNLKMDFYQYFD